MKNTTANPYKSAEAMNAAQAQSEIGPDYIRALFSMVLRGVELDGPRTAKAWLTPWRYLEVTKEDDGGISAWAVGLIEIAGKMTATSVYLGAIVESSQVVRIVRQAKMVIAEAIERGSRGFPMIGEATGPNGERVFLYHLRAMNREQSAGRVDAWMNRNGVILLGDSKVAPKVTLRKAKKAA